jgi:hypothetical protein
MLLSLETRQVVYNIFSENMPDPKWKPKPNSDPDPEKKSHFESTTLLLAISMF